MTLYDPYTGWRDQTAATAPQSGYVTLTAFLAILALIVGFAIYGEATGFDPDMAGAPTGNDWHGNVSASGWEPPTVTGVAGSDNRAGNSAAAAWGE